MQLVIFLIFINLLPVLGGYIFYSFFFLHTWKDIVVFSCMSLHQSWCLLFLYWFQQLVEGLHTKLPSMHFESTFTQSLLSTWAKKNTVTLLIHPPVFNANIWLSELCLLMTCFAKVGKYTEGPICLVCVGRGDFVTEIQCILNWLLTFASVAFFLSCSLSQCVIRLLLVQVMKCNVSCSSLNPPDLYIFWFLLHFLWKICLTLPPSLPLTDFRR